MLRLASLTSFAISLCLAACGTATIASNTGGSGTGGSNTGGSGAGGSTSSSSSGGGSSTTSSSSSSGGPTCSSLGGTCVPDPGSCVNGTFSGTGPASYGCSQFGSAGCCLPAFCPNPCPTQGAVRCIAGAIETCDVNPDDTPCGLQWMITTSCGLDETCNSDGTKCVSGPAQTCNASTDCGCGCGCVAGMCECTGGLPPSCANDSDCGPACSGYRCDGGKCAPPACTPGQDQSCNENPAMNSFAGRCNPDATCTCNDPFTKQASGKCG